MPPKLCVARGLSTVTNCAGTSRAVRCLCAWLTVFVCAVTQLCAVSSRVYADIADASDGSGNTPRGAHGRWLGSPRRARFPRLSVLGRSDRLQLSRTGDDGPEETSSLLIASERALAALQVEPVRRATAHSASQATSRPIGATPRGGVQADNRSSALAQPAHSRDVAELARALRRRELVARSFMLVGGGAVSAGLIAAGLAYSANRAYAQKEPWERADASRASAELARSERTGTVAGSLLGAGGAALISGLALKLWNLRRADTRIEGRLTARPHKLGGMLAIQGSWGGAL